MMPSTEALCLLVGGVPLLVLVVGSYLIRWLSNIGVDDRVPMLSGVCHRRSNGNVVIKPRLHFFRIGLVILTGILALVLVLFVALVTAVIIGRESPLALLRALPLLVVTAGVLWWAVVTTQRLRSAPRMVFNPTSQQLEIGRREQQRVIPFANLNMIFVSTEIINFAAPLNMELALVTTENELIPLGGVVGDAPQTVNKNVEKLTTFLGDVTRDQVTISTVAAQTGAVRYATPRQLRLWSADLSHHDNGDITIGRRIRFDRSASVLRRGMSSIAFATIKGVYLQGWNGWLGLRVQAGVILTDDQRVSFATASRMGTAVSAAQMVVQALAGQGHAFRDDFTSLEQRRLLTGGEYRFCWQPKSDS